MKTRAAVTEIEKRQQKKINKTKSWFFEKINKIDKHLGWRRKEDLNK